MASGNEHRALYREPCLNFYENGADVKQETTLHEPRFYSLRGVSKHSVQSGVQFLAVLLSNSRRRDFLRKNPRTCSNVAVTAKAVFFSQNFFLSVRLLVIPSLPCERERNSPASSKDDASK